MSAKWCLFDTFSSLSWLFFIPTHLGWTKIIMFSLLWPAWCFRSPSTCSQNREPHFRGRMELEGPEVQKQGWGVFEADGLARILPTGLFEVEMDETKENRDGEDQRLCRLHHYQENTKAAFQWFRDISLCHKQNPLIYVTGEEGEVWIKGWCPPGHISIHMSQVPIMAKGAAGKGVLAPGNLIYSQTKALLQGNGLLLFLFQKKEKKRKK